MRPSRVAIATITLARSKTEERSLIRSLGDLAALKLPVVAADGGSERRFCEFVQQTGCTLVHPRSPGLVAQVKASLRTALRTHDGPFVLYTEPDKSRFFKERLIEFLSVVRQRPKLALVFASRD